MENMTKQENILVTLIVCFSLQATLIFYIDIIVNLTQLQLHHKECNKIIYTAIKKQIMHRYHVGKGKRPILFLWIGVLPPRLPPLSTLAKIIITTLWICFFTFVTLPPTVGQFD